MVIEETRDHSIRGMIDISKKQEQYRKAVAEGKIYLSQESLLHIKNQTNPKGDVLENAKLAAILAVKKTPELVFMCHSVKVKSIVVKFNQFENYILTTVEVVAIDQTGVEIEAVAGVMNALLAIFDLSKRYEKDEQGQYPVARITDIKVVKKIKE